jgi:uncharacterized protein YqkB
VKKFFKWTAIIIVGLVVVSMFLGDDEETPTTAKVGEKKVEQKEEKKDQVYKVGDTIQVGDLQLTITKASFTNPAEYSPSKKGKVLTLEIATENKGESAFIDSSDFNIYDKEGNQLDDYFGYDEMAISGDLNKGKKMAGKLYYDVPQSDSYELIYEPTFSWSDEEYKFNIIPQ